MTKGKTRAALLLALAFAVFPETAVAAAFIFASWQSFPTTWAFASTVLLLRAWSYFTGPMVARTVKEWRAINGRP